MGAPRRAHRQGRGPDRRLRLRWRLPGLHRVRASSRASMPGRSRSGCSASSAPAPGAAVARRSPPADDRPPRPARRSRGGSTRYRAAPSGPARAGRPGDAPAPRARRRPRPGRTTGRRASTARSSRPERARSSGARRRPGRSPLDRVRLATLPGQPPPDAPLVCLDTETTGLATAAGTVAFLVGLGWWVGIVPPGPAAAAGPRRRGRPARGAGAAPAARRAGS